MASPRLKCIQFACFLLISSYGIANAQGGFPGGGGPGGPGGTIEQHFDLDVLKRANVEERMQALGNDLLGDQIDPNTGSLSFSHVDVSIPGNSDLEVAIRRTRSFGDPYTQFNNNYTASNGKASLSFGDWELEVPKVFFVSATPYSVCASTEPATATAFTTVVSNGMPTAPNATNNVATPGKSHSNGVRVSVPARTNGLLLDNPVAGMAKSGANKTNLDHWSFECISGNGGLIGTAPNGDTYHFDEKVSRPAKRITMQTFSRSGTNSSSSYGYQERFELVYQVSRVEDVHGNWVDYDYNAQGWLVEIASNDLRLIEIVRDNQGFIDEIKANNRTWLYSYEGKPNGGRLTGVTRPDGLAWSFDLAFMTYDPAQYWGNCPNGPYSNSVTVTHPHGAKGTFTFQDTKHFRAPANTSATPYPNVPTCEKRGIPENDPDTFQSSAYNIIASVIEKRLDKNANGTDAAIWTYDYSEETLPLSQGQKWTDVTDPAGTRVRRMYHVDDQVEFDGLIDWAKTYNSSGVVVSETDYDYVFEAPLGTTWLENENTNRLTRPRRTIETVVTQDSDTFTTESDFNTNQASSSYSFGKPIAVRTFSNVNSTPREITRTYENKISNWILALPKTIALNGLQMSVFTNDNDGQMTNQTRFGVPFMEINYNPDGTINWVADALDRRTTAQLWKRGMPQKIIQADGHDIEQNVDNNGWMTSSKDALDRVNTYTYDAMGRLTLINPHGSWANTSISYNFSGGGAVQTITKGQSRTTLTYDGLFRPTLERTQALDTGWSSYVNTEYDALGRVTFKSQSSTNPSESKGVNTSYDALGRVLTVAENVSPFATTTHSYHSGHRHRITDPQGDWKDYYSYGYDGPNNRDYSRIVEDSLRETQINKNIYGQTESVVQHGNQGGVAVNATQYFYYNSQQRLCGSSTPEAGGTRYQYDNAGQMIAYAKGQSVSASCPLPSGTGKVSQSYDPMGRPKLTNFNHSGTPDITRSYDNNGNLLTLNRGSGGSV